MGCMALLEFFKLFNYHIVFLDKYIKLKIKN